VELDATAPEELLISAVSLASINFYALQLATAVFLVSTWPDLAPLSTWSLQLAELERLAVELSVALQEEVEAEAEGSTAT